MALGFIKKVFTFGKERSTDVLAPQDEVGSADDQGAEQPLLPSEIEAAEKITAERNSNDDAEPAAVPVSDQLGTIGVVPLSLLKAESEAATTSVPSEHLEREGLAKRDEPVTGSDNLTADAPETLGDSADDELDVPLNSLFREPAEVRADPVFPPAGETSAPLTGGDEQQPSKVAEASISTPILPKGFATGPAPEPGRVSPKPKLTWFQRLRAGLARTSSQLTGQITALFTKRKLDEQTLQDLEDLLIQADLGVETAMRVADTLSSERYGKDVTGEDVSRIMASEIAKVLKPVAKPLQLDLSHKPHVILVVGVNGTGKTTTIGKLAAKLTGAGLKVTVAAGDTFRAAAIEQLKIWAERTKSEFIGTKLGADAAGLAYDAFQQAKADRSDVLIIDTAGRLQNKAELMAELEKIVRVLGKLDPEAPHTVLQTLDATTGQNALSQVEIFRNVAGVNGLIMTKLDGTARGGILVAISAKHKLPVYFIGVGEGVDDLEPFEADEFAQAIAGLAPS
jgi:fused signal recognition particle receptor